MAWKSRACSCFAALAYLMLSLPAIAVAEQCKLGPYSKLLCLSKGDFGNLDRQMCTICNLFVKPDGKFWFRQNPADQKQFQQLSIKKLEFPWKPATGFAYYGLTVHLTSDEVLDSTKSQSAASGPNSQARSASTLENTTVYVVPRLEGNYCHAFNDVLAPIFWRIRQQQQSTTTIDITKVVLFTLNTRMKPRRDINHLIPYFSNHTPITTRNLPKGVLHIREAVVGALGMTVHMNQNYYWHGSRYMRWPPFSMRSIATNLQLLGQHLRTALGASEPDRVRIDNEEGMIVLANRRNNSRGRSMLNADQVLQAFQERFGATHKVYPQVLYFEDLSMEELAQLLARTKVLLAPHGAGLSNIVMMRRGAALIELIPFMCHRLRIMFSPIAQAAGLRYSYWQPTDNLVPALITSKQKTYAMHRASSKEEPCSKDMSRWNFYGSAPHLAEEVAAALDHVAEYTGLHQ